jgi:hypothetical protein
MLINKLDRRTLVLAWIGLWSTLIVIVGLGASGCTSTARAETSAHIVDVSSVEVVTPPVEFHVTPTSFYMVETIGEAKTYMIDDIIVDVEPGTLTLFN